ELCALCGESSSSSNKSPTPKSPRPLRTSVTSAVNSYLRELLSPQKLHPTPPHSHTRDLLHVRNPSPNKNRRSILRLRRKRHRNQHCHLLLIQVPAPKAHSSPRHINARHNIVSKRIRLHARDKIHLRSNSRAPLRSFHRLR